MSDMYPDRFLEDVLASPASLRALADAYPHGPGIELEGRRVVLLGMGSSRFAAITVAAGLRARGIDANAEIASTGAPQPPSPDTTVIAISASGGSAETLAAMRLHAGLSSLVGLTNRPESALGLEADRCLALHAGPEVSGIACRSYQATLALLHMIAGVSSDRIRAAADASEALLAGRDAWLEQAVGLLEGDAVHVLAPAERIGSAEQSALMLREVPRVRADACETGDWSHVDVYLSKRPGLGLLMLRGSAWEPEVLEWAGQRGFPVVTVGGALAGAALDIPLHDVGDPVIRSLVEHHEAELVAAELWRRRPI
jgi:fructoselysine-6-P-deglycase FrlB-like protein